MSYDRTEVERILQTRDGVTAEYARELLEEARQAVRNGDDPEEVVYIYFGLEPDYIWAVI